MFLLIAEGRTGTFYCLLLRQLVSDGAVSLALIPRLILAYQNIQINAVSLLLGIQTAIYSISDS